MTPVNRSVHGTNFTVSIEAAHGVTTGISAADRAHTIRVAAAANATPDDIVQPGHVFPLMAQPGGVLARAGHTEACCDLARLAGHSSSAVLCEIMNDDGTMARLPDLEVFAQRARAEDRLDRRSDPSSQPHRAADRARRRAPADDAGRRVPPRRLPRQAVRRDASRADARTDLARHRNAGARARAAVGDRPARCGERIAFVEHSRGAARDRRGGPRRHRAPASRRKRAGAAPARDRRRVARLGRRWTCATTASARRSCAT